MLDEASNYFPPKRVLGLVVAALSGVAATSKPIYNSLKKLHMIWPADLLIVTINVLNGSEIKADQSRGYEPLW